MEKKPRQQINRKHLKPNAPSLLNAGDCFDNHKAKRVLVTEKELATILGVSPYWCQKARWRGDGPPFIRVGPSSIRYHIPSVELWLQNRIMTSTSQAMEEES